MVVSRACELCSLIYFIYIYIYISIYISISGTRDEVDKRFGTTTRKAINYLDTELYTIAMHCIKLPFHGPAPVSRTERRT